MGESDQTLLDLSHWPAAPPVATLPRRPGLPARPAPSRGLPAVRLSLLHGAAIAAALGTALLVVPVGRCGPALRAWTAAVQPAPADAPPQLDDAVVARDAAAVTAAQRALATWHPAPATTAAPARPTSSATRTVSAADPAEVAADRRAVAQAQEQVDADQAELDRVLAEQDAASDPGAYDEQVAAAREQLDGSVAELADAQRQLRAAQSRVRTLRVTTAPATTSPAPATRSSAPARAELVAALQDAQQLQAAHLAARQKALADSRAEHQRAVALVDQHNAQVRSCARRAAVPGSSGVGALVVAAALAATRVVRARLGR